MLMNADVQDLLYAPVRIAEPVERDSIQELIHGDRHVSSDLTSPCIGVWGLHPASYHAVPGAGRAWFFRPRNAATHANCGLRLN
jgi:hypothetical protein